MAVHFVWKDGTLCCKMPGNKDPQAEPVPAEITLLPSGDERFICIEGQRQMTLLPAKWRGIEHSVCPTDMPGWTSQESHEVYCAEYGGRTVTVKLLQSSERKFETRPKWEAALLERRVQKQREKADRLKASYLRFREIIDSDAPMAFMRKIAPCDFNKLTGHFSTYVDLLGRFITEHGLTEDAREEYWWKNEDQVPFSTELLQVLQDAAQKIRVERKRAWRAASSGKTIVTLAAAEE